MVSPCIDLFRCGLRDNWSLVWGILDGFVQLLFMTLLHYCWLFYIFFISYKTSESMYFSWNARSCRMRPEGIHCPAQVVWGQWIPFWAGFHTFRMKWASPKEETAAWGRGAMTGCCSSRCKWHPTVGHSFRFLRKSSCSVWDCFVEFKNKTALMSFRITPLVEFLGDSQPI